MDIEKFQALTKRIDESNIQYAANKAEMIRLQAALKTTHELMQKLGEKRRQLIDELHAMAGFTPDMWKEL